MATIEGVQVLNVATGELWTTHEIAEESPGRVVVLVDATHPPTLSFFGPDDRYVIRGTIDGAGFESDELELDTAESEEDVEFIFR
jgi:hypothetical protein